MLKANLIWECPCPFRENSKKLAEEGYLFVHTLETHSGRQCDYAYLPDREEWAGPASSTDREACLPHMRFLTAVYLPPGDGSQAMPEVIQTEFSRRRF